MSLAQTNTSRPCTGTFIPNGHPNGAIILNSCTGRPHTKLHMGDPDDMGGIFAQTSTAPGTQTTQ